LLCVKNHLTCRHTTWPGLFWDFSTRPDSTRGSGHPPCNSGSSLQELHGGWTDPRVESCLVEKSRKSSGGQVVWLQVRWCLAHYNITYWTDYWFNLGRDGRGSGTNFHPRTALRLWSSIPQARARADYKTNSSRRSAGINKFRPRHHSDLQIAPRRVLTRDFDRSPLVARPSRVYDISGDDAFVSERFNDLRLRLTSCIGLDDSRWGLLIT